MQSIRADAREARFISELELFLFSTALMVLNVKKEEYANGIILFAAQCEMQCGFAFLEAGAVRSKNTVNILIKNMLDALIGGISYWAIGWGLAYGADGNAFCGGSEYFSFNMPHDNYPSWFFQFVFAATAATIVSGAIAERCNFSAYFAYSILITGELLSLIQYI